MRPSTGLKTILTEESHEILAKKETLHPQQVNHAVSFNAIKNQVFELLHSDLDIKTVIDRLQELFLMNPTVNRPARKVPRKTASLRQRLNHCRRRLKICF